MSKNSFFTVAFLAIIFAAAVYFFSRHETINRNTDRNENKNYHVLVLGEAENAGFIRKVYDGAKNIGEAFNAVIELHVPKSIAENTSMDDLLNYAEFVNADGIIAYMTETSKFNYALKRIDDEGIPVIGIGDYFPDVPQVSYIGTNYSELGRQIGITVEGFDSPETHFFIISDSNLKHPNYSNTANSLQAYLTRRKITNFSFIDKSRISNEEDFLQLTKGSGCARKITVCFSEDTTLFLCQLMSSYVKHENLGIIGVGGNETLKMYFDKGIISALVYTDPSKIGEDAVRELFEFRSTGYANSYISAEIRVLKNEAAE